GRQATREGAGCSICHGADRKQQNAVRRLAAERVIAREGARRSPRCQHNGYGHGAPPCLAVEEANSQLQAVEGYHGSIWQVKPPPVSGEPPGQSALSASR